MATKAKVMKMLQEIRGLAQITTRRPQPRLPGLLFLQLRPQAPLSAPPGRRRVIPIQVQEHTDIPTPVDIVHLKTEPELGE
jgi:hypothetical protein